MIQKEIKYNLHYDEVRDTYYDRNIALDTICS